MYMRVYFTYSILLIFFVWLVNCKQRDDEDEDKIRHNRVFGHKAGGVGQTYEDFSATEAMPMFNVAFRDDKEKSDDDVEDIDGNEEEEKEENEDEDDIEDEEMGEKEENDGDKEKSLSLSEGLEELLNDFKDSENEPPHESSMSGFPSYEERKYPVLVELLSELLKMESLIYPQINKIKETPLIDPILDGPKSLEDYYEEKGEYNKYSKDLKESDNVALPKPDRKFMKNGGLSGHIDFEAVEEGDSPDTIPIVKSEDVRRQMFLLPPPFRRTLVPERRGSNPLCVGIQCFLGHMKQGILAALDRDEALYGALKDSGSATFRESLSLLTADFEDLLGSSKVNSVFCRCLHALLSQDYGPEVLSRAFQSAITSHHGMTVFDNVINRMMDTDEGKDIIDCGIHGIITSSGGKAALRKGLMAILVSEKGDTEIFERMQTGLLETGDEKEDVKIHRLIKMIVDHQGNATGLGTAARAMFLPPKGADILVNWIRGLVKCEAGPDSLVTYMDLLLQEEHGDEVLLAGIHGMLVNDDGIRAFTSMLRSFKSSEYDRVDKLLSDLKEVLENDQWLEWEVWLEMAKLPIFKYERKENKIRETADDLGLFNSIVNSVHEDIGFEEGDRESYCIECGKYSKEKENEKGITKKKDERDEEKEVPVVDEDVCPTNILKPDDIERVKDFIHPFKKLFEGPQTEDFIRDMFRHVSKNKLWCKEMPRCHAEVLSSKHGPEAFLVWLQAVIDHPQGLRVLQRGLSEVFSKEKRQTAFGNFLKGFLSTPKDTPLMKELKDLVYTEKLTNENTIRRIVEIILDSDDGSKGWAAGLSSVLSSDDSLPAFKTFLMGASRSKHFAIIISEANAAMLSSKYGPESVVVLHDCARFGKHRIKLGEILTDAIKSTSYSKKDDLIDAFHEFTDDKALDRWNKNIKCNRQTYHRADGDTLDEIDELIEKLEDKLDVEFEEKEEEEEEEEKEKEEEEKEEKEKERYEEEEEEEEEKKRTTTTDNPDDIPGMEKIKDEEKMMDEFLEGSRRNEFEYASLRSMGMAGPALVGPSVAEPNAPDETVQVNNYELTKKGVTGSTLEAVDAHYSSTTEDPYASRREEEFEYPSLRSRGIAGPALVGQSAAEPSAPDETVEVNNYQMTKKGVTGSTLEIVDQAYSSTTEEPYRRIWKVW